MPGRSTPLVVGEFYHIFNRGNEKQNIFLQPRDYKRFKQTFYYYQYKGPKPKFSNFAKSKLNTSSQLGSKIVDIVCYCLMPNHFHLLVRQLSDNGISNFMSKLSNSYTKYVNTKYHRVGVLFQGTFKSVIIETDEQLIHLSRYIHLNPIVSGLTKKLGDYPWSSYEEFINSTNNFCEPKVVLDLFSTNEKYQEFVKDQIDYGTTLEIIKHQTIEEI